MAIHLAAKRQKLSPPEEAGLDQKNRLSEYETKRPIKEDFYKRAAEWDLEQSYEQRPRKQKKKDRENTRLPIKTLEGKIEALQVAGGEKNESDGWLGPESEGEHEVNEYIATEAVSEEPKISIRQQIWDAKEELARIASHINEDPEENAGGFKALGRIAEAQHPTIKKFALATQLVVYKDAIPGYRIRPLAEESQTEKVSKEVKRLRIFEQSLVGAYQNYVKELARCAKLDSEKHAREASSLANVAISSACALLLAVPHFNFRSDLLKILVGKLSTRKIDSNFEKCQNTLVTFFTNDGDGVASLDAVTLLTRMMKARNYKINESVLNVFLHLRLLSEFSSKASQNHVDRPITNDGLTSKKPKFKKEFRTKKQRKLIKERKIVETEFKEADAIVSHEQRDRMQAETLKLVFTTYFRILKARTSHLIGAVLEGLAKYTHLINQDFFGDLLEALKDLIKGVESSLESEATDAEEKSLVSNRTAQDSSRESLLCITTAFTLLNGQDATKSTSSLNLDLTFFTMNLYRSLHALAINPDLELSSRSLRLPDPDAQIFLNQRPSNTLKVNLRTTTVLLLRALTSILQPRNVPPVRLAAFVKQLCISSLHLPEKSDLALLSLLNDLAKTHGRKVASLWNTEERRGDGIFDPFREDLEGSNPFASTIWEGELLKFHFSPEVRKAATDIESVIRLGK